MSDTTDLEDIFRIVWRACDTFRGTVDPSEYKNYILTMLFIKYMSDQWKDKRAGYEAKYQGDKTRVERAMARERFVVPKECDFDHLYAHREAANIGEMINIALTKIEDVNKSKLENVFRNIDFNSEPALGQTRERNRRLRNLLDGFNDPKLDLRPSRLGNRDVIGDVYEYLIGRFAAGAGKKAGEFYTPPEVSTLLAKLLAPKPGARICDPACGSGSLLIKVGREVGSNDFSLFGQESNGSTWALCRMNMFLHEMDAARIEWCDTLNSPRLIEGDKLMQFDIVAANPPFSLEQWGQEGAAADKFNRYWRGIPPKSKGDYAFITHMVETALSDVGKVGVIVPHGVLFRGGQEGAIRERLIEQNLLDLVVGLPPNLFYGTGIPAAILVFDKARAAGRHPHGKSVLFIDASREFDDGTNQNRLRTGKDGDVERIVSTYKAFKTVDKYAYKATFDEIKENDFNLNIPRYVDTFEEEVVIDISKVQKEIGELESELAQTQKQMAKYMKELGYGG